MRWEGHVTGKDRRVVWWEYLKEESYLKDLGVDGKIILTI
jgi:hypothetical protein